MDSKVRSHIDELSYVLDKLVTLHRNLLDILREELSHITNLDIKGLGEAGQAKELLLHEIWNHEQLRIQSAMNLAQALSLNTGEITLLAIAEKLPKEIGEKLCNAREVLNLLVFEAKDLNSYNIGFVESSLGLIEEMKKNALGINHSSSKENYSNSGVRQPTTEQGGRLLSTEA